MPKKAGPWSLDKVKEELEASARYRQLEAKRAKEETVAGTSLSRCVLVVLALFFLVLFVVVLALCAVIVTLVKKENA
jgi:lipopolysaccharide/colanic/teichoic acid biosynthesis glycosyltransferase